MPDPQIPPLYWDGCQFYADAGKSTQSAGEPHRGRYSVMYLTSYGEWAYQGHVDELPETAERLDLPTGDPTTTEETSRG